MTGNEHCVTCKYCEMPPDLAAHSQGICRLSPPTMQMVNGPQGSVSMALATVVRVTTDWCGQHMMQLVKPVGGLVIEMGERK